MKMRKSVLTLALLPLLTLTACGDDEKTVYKDGEGNSVTVKTDGKDSDGNVNINLSSKDGDVSINAGDNVDQKVAMPFDLPRLAGAKIVAHMSAKGTDNANGAMVQMTTTQSVDDVIAFYKKSATEAGFEVKSEVTVNNMKQISAERAAGAKKDSFMLSVTPGEGDDAGQTSVSLIAGMGG